MSSGTIEIFSERTIADLVAWRLDRRITSTLVRPSTRDTQGGKGPVVSITIITHCGAVHKWLSSFGPQVFIDEVGSDRRRGGMGLTMGKVGAFSGDVVVQLKGQINEVFDAIGLFLMKTKVEERPYSICMMIDRAAKYIGFEYPAGVELIFNKVTIIGDSVTISSYQLKDVLLLVSCISHWCKIQLDVKQLCKSIGPSLQEPDEITAEQLPDLKSQSNQLSQPVTAALDAEETKENREERLPKYVKLTRKEITYIIGKKGSKIELIRETSRATVKVVPLNTKVNGTDSVHRAGELTQFLRVSGTQKQVQRALRLIEQEIYQFRIHGVTEY